MTYHTDPLNPEHDKPKKTVYDKVRSELDLIFNEKEGGYLPMVMMALEEIWQRSEEFEVEPGLDRRSGFLDPWIKRLEDRYNRIVPLPGFEPDPDKPEKADDNWTRPAMLTFQIQELCDTGLQIAFKKLGKSLMESRQNDILERSFTAMYDYFSYSEFGIKNIMPTLLDTYPEFVAYEAKRSWDPDRILEESAAHILIAGEKTASLIAQLTLDKIEVSSFDSLREIYTEIIAKSFGEQPTIWPAERMRDVYSRTVTPGEESVQLLRQEMRIAVPEIIGRILALQTQLAVESKMFAYLLRFVPAST